MTRRIAAIELRRSATAWIGLLVLAAGWAALDDPERWTGRWSQLMFDHRSELTFLWPVVVAAAAWLSRREHASRLDDLLTSTPRPAWSRAAPRAALLIAGIAGGYLVILAAYLAETLPAAAYQPPGWFGPVAVGTLSVASAALLGLGLGRLMPYRLTAPAVLVLGLTAVAVLPSIWRGTGSPALLLAPGSPLGDDFSAMTGRTNLGQALWFSALATGGFVLLVARRPWLAVVLPVVLGCAVAVAVLPGADQATHHDVGASRLVCTVDRPRVCVTAVYAPVLSQLVGPARAALRKLSRLPDPPSAVVQDIHNPGFPVAQDPAEVHVSLAVDHDGHVVTGLAPLEHLILDGAGTWMCGGHDGPTWDRLQAARVVARGWLEGGSQPPVDSPWLKSLIATAWTALHTLPADEQLARIAALRQAALKCQDNLYDILTAPTRR